MAMRWVTLALLVLLGLVQAGLWVGDGGLSHVMKLQVELQGLQQRIADQKQQNIRLMAEVDDLRGGLEMVEESARRELGMVKPHEVFVQYASLGAAGRSGLGGPATAPATAPSPAPAATR